MESMIVYRLTCKRGHEFEAWFRDSAACDAQIADGKVICPHCGDSSARKSLMTPNVAPGAGGKPDDGLAARRAAVLRELQALRRKVEENCDYVGPRFAEEARRIHYGETDAHAIYGETTPGEAEALADEGIAFGRIPWAPRMDS